MAFAEPALEEWRPLYEAAIAFRDLAPWRWMADDQLFAVQDPQTGEIGYCCVLGALGEVLGLQVYPGPEGYRCYRKFQSGEVSASDLDLPLYLKCLNAEFKDRKALDPTDRKIIRALGLTFRGRHAWPCFRSYRPLHYPWYLEVKEASFLTHALEQALEVCRRVKEDPGALNAADGRNVLTRVRSESGKGWKDAWTPRPSEAEEPRPIPPADPAVLEELRRMPGVRSTTWEADFYPVPTWIASPTGGPPYNPIVYMLADHTSGLVLAADIEAPKEPPRFLRDRLLFWIRVQKRLPREILVRRPSSFSALEPVAAALGVELRLRPRLQAIEPAVQSLARHIMRHS